MDPTKPTNIGDVPVQPLSKSGKPVPLNQPFPKEIANAPMVEIAEHVGQTVMEKAVKQRPVEIRSATPISAAAGVISATGITKIKAKPNDEKDTLKSKNAEQSKSKKRDDKADDGTVASFKANDFIKESAASSKAAKKDSKKATSNPIVKTLVSIGLVLATLGLVFFLFINRPPGIVFMMLGCIAIIACVFLPIGIKSKK